MVIKFLDAQIMASPSEHDRPVTVISFKDDLLKYEMWVMEDCDSVFICSDAERPIQGLPSFEISLPCCEMATFPRGGMPYSLGIYSGPPSQATLLFSIVRREDGRISLSGAWDEMFSSRRSSEANR